VSGAAHFRLQDASIRLDAIPAAGRELRITPGPGERAALAARLGIDSVDALEVDLCGVTFRGGIRVRGRLTARVTQTSVVSLAPVGQSIDAPIDRVFLPGGEKPFAGPAGAEVFVDLEGDDIPDHFEGNEADLTELIVETLALGLDPYPRAEGENLDDLGLKPDVIEDHPFAALKALKPQQD
jgi:hypothetical protein